MRWGRASASRFTTKKQRLAACSIFASKYLSPEQSGYSLESGELWKNSVSSAIAAELVADEVGYSNSGAAYTAGLLQDIGKIILADYVDNAFIKIENLVEKENIAWEDAGRRVVGIPHPEVGAMLLQRWGFPEALIDSVRSRHKLMEAEIDKPLAYISHFSDALVMTVGIGL